MKTHELSIVSSHVSVSTRITLGSAQSARRVPARIAHVYLAEIFLNHSPEVYVRCLGRWEERVIVKRGGRFYTRTLKNGKIVEGALA